MDESEKDIVTVEKIRELKKKYGYSNAKLSDASGVPLGTVNKVLSGATAAPRYDTLQALAAPLLELEDQEPRSKSSVKLKNIEAGNTEAGNVEIRNTEAGYRQASSDSILREEASAYGIPAGKGPGDFTVEDYYALSDEHRAELIDGVFYDMAAPSTVHQRIALEIVFAIKTFLLTKGGNCMPFISPVDVRLDSSDDKTIVQPDVLIVCDPSKVDYTNINGAPDFILEVVSPSTSGRDYYRKATKYEQCGVREYWIIDPIRMRLTICYYETREPIQILPLEGKKGIGIFNNELEIDLDIIADICGSDYK